MSGNFFKDRLSNFSFLFQIKGITVNSFHKLIIPLLLGLFLINGTIMATEKDKKDKKVFPFDYTEITLENGLKAIIIPFDSPGLVAYYSVVRTGSRDEWEPGKSGFAHFFEHMMFRGTERFPGNVYDSIVTSLGADANAYTSDDLTVYHLNFAAEDLETVMDIESDRFRNLKYTKEQFQTESGAVYGEYRKGRTSPWSVAIEELRNMAFDKHTYKHTTIGFEQDIKDMPNQYEYSLSFYDRYYRPSNVVLVIVGDVDVSKTKSLVEKYYSPWKPGYTAPVIEPEPDQTAPRRKDVQYDGKTLPVVIMAYKSDAFDVKNKNFLSSIHLADLAFGETSEIYNKLVLKEQKVQFISASAGMSRDPYMFEIYTMVKNPDDIEYVISEIRKTLESFTIKLVEDKDLDDLKMRNKYGFLMSLDNQDAVAGSLPQYITMTGDIKVIDEFYNALDDVTPDDIMKAAKTYFTSSRENIIVLRGNK